MSLPFKLQQMVDDFAPLEDPHERLSAVIDRAKSLPPLPADQRTDAHRVRGCISVVWLIGELRDGRCYFRTDAESPLVRGLVAFVADFFTGETPAEIAASDADPLAALDLLRNLSPTRRNGLASAAKTIRDFARAHVPA